MCRIRPQSVSWPLRSPSGFLPAAALVALFLLTLPVVSRSADRSLFPEPSRLEAVKDSAEAVRKNPRDTAIPPPASPAVLAARDTASDTTQTRTAFYDYVAHPVLQALTVPIDLVVVPTAEVLLIPIKEPLRYFLKEEVIDRTINLISFGDKEQVMIYPTLNLASGTGSYTGLTLRHTALFGRPQERLVAMGNIYVNGDWRFRTYVTTREILGTDFDAKASIQLTRQRNASVNQPDTNLTWNYADTSSTYSLSLGHPLFEKVAGRVGGSWRRNNFSLAPTNEDPLKSDFFRNDAGVLDPSSRGLEKIWNDWNISLGLARDTRNNENIPLAGSDSRIFWHYHFTDAGHNYHAWEGIWSGFFKLGKERYEITSQEERERGDMDIKKVLKDIDLRRMRDQMFTRKVVALHFYAAQSFEVEGNRMPVYGLQTLGNGTPMRGYKGSRFRDYTVVSAGMEYRFPVMRLLDGVLFNEYGVFGRDWRSLHFEDNLRNSWGIGIRVRRPDIFLVRTDFGLHGINGILINLSVDAAY